MRFLLRQVLWGLLILACLAVPGLHWLAAEMFLAVEAPLPLSDTRSLLVAEGTGLNGLLRQLEADGLMHDAWRARVYVRWRGLPTTLRAGEYALRPGMNFLDVLNDLTQGRAVLHRLTLVEGWRFRELRQALASQPALSKLSLSWSDADIMAALDEPGRSPEGLFFPDTYFFQRGDSDLAVLRRARRALKQQLEQQWQGRDPKVDTVLQDPYEALILASLVEKETAAVAERPLIAGVFLERLRLGMRLQTDPSVIFGLGEAFQGDLRRQHLETDGPYNTYTRAGLPPTPIALVGRAALRAVSHPEWSGFLYFVARGDGTHHFSSSYPEHQLAVHRYQIAPSVRRTVEPVPAP